MDALDSVTTKTAGAVAVVGSATVALATVTPGSVGVTPLATPLICRPVTADPVLVGLAWNPNDVLCPAVT